MRVFLGLGDVQLLQTLAGDVFAEGILQVVLGEEDVYARERVVVGRHAVVLQVGDGRHALLRHVLLREHRGQFLGTVAAEVEEDDDVALADAPVDVAVDQRLHELVGVLVFLAVAVVARLHALHHVVHLAPLSVHDEVVGQFDAVPVLVAVHGVVAADDRRDAACARLVHVPLHVSNKTLARVGVRVAPVHEAVYVAVRDVIHLRDVDELQQVVQRRVDAARRRQAHQVQVLAAGLGIAVGRLNLRVL